MGTLTLALATSRPTNQACMDGRNPRLWVVLLGKLFDHCRLEENHGTTAAALLAPAAIPPVLAEADAAALIAPAALSPVPAEADAAAVLAPAALPPVLALPSHSTFAQPWRARTASAVLASEVIWRTGMGRNR